MAIEMAKDDSAKTASKGSTLTWWILGALVLGIVVGAVVKATVPDPTAIVEGLTLVTTVFLRLIKMIIGPLVFATLAVGIAKILFFVFIVLFLISAALSFFRKGSPGVKP